MYTVEVLSDTTVPNTFRSVHHPLPSIATRLYKLLLLLLLLLPL